MLHVLLSIINSTMKGDVRVFTGTQKVAFRMKINNNWTDVKHFTSRAAVLKQNCEATIQLGEMT
jgi:hypothetical protein